MNCLLGLQCPFFFKNQIAQWKKKSKKILKNKTPNKRETGGPTPLTRFIDRGFLDTFPRTLINPNFRMQIRVFVPLCGATPDMKAIRDDFKKRLKKNKQNKA